MTKRENQKEGGYRSSDGQILPLRTIVDKSSSALSSAFKPVSSLVGNSKEALNKKEKEITNFAINRMAEKLGTSTVRFKRKYKNVFYSIRDKVNNELMVKKFEEFKEETEKKTRTIIEFIEEFIEKAVKEIIEKAYKSKIKIIFKKKKPKEEYIVSPQEEYMDFSDVRRPDIHSLQKFLYSDGIIVIKQFNVTDRFGFVETVEKNFKELLEEYEILVHVPDPRRYDGGKTRRYKKSRKSSQKNRRVSQ